MDGDYQVTTRITPLISARAMEVLVIGVGIGACAGLANPHAQFVLGSTNREHILFPSKAEITLFAVLASQDSPLVWTLDGRFLYVLRGSPCRMRSQRSAT